MVVRGSGVGNSYLQSTVEKAVAIKLFDGSWLYKEVTDLEPDDQTTIITFDDAFTLDVALGDVVGLYWLNVCRFATDAMTVQWITNEVAQTVLQIKTLEALPAEV
jgi:hypothetical protein